MHTLTFFSSEILLRQVGIVLDTIITLVLQCKPQSDQHIDASINCRGGGLAVLLVASRTELKHRGLFGERLRHLLQGSGCPPDRATDRVRLDSLYASHPLISDNFFHGRKCSTY